MAGHARDRQRATRQAQSRAAAAVAAQARRRQLTKKIIAVLAVFGIIATLVVAAFVSLGDDDQTVTAGGSTTTSLAVPTTAGLTSVAGQPCVAPVDPLPEGSPDVPVVVGPPPTELVVTDITPGTGAVVGATDTLTVNYTGVACSTGLVFDSSYERGAPATFPLDQVIPGWRDGLAGVQVGGVRLLGIPAEQAYGSGGSPPDIAPDEALWFVVEVLEATPAA